MSSFGTTFRYSKQIYCFVNQGSNYIQLDFSGRLPNDLV